MTTFRKRKEVIMALLISTNPFAQQEILSGMLRVFKQHSVESRNSFADRIQYLASNTNVDIVITGYFHRSDQPEFGLCWFQKNNPLCEHLHPLEKSQNPLMVGGLVFHGFDESWGVHT